MADYVLIDGDRAIFRPTFGMATVVVKPGTLVASGPATQGGAKMCVVGDERSVSVPGCMYMTPQYSIPGTGTLEIAALAGDQRATKTRTNGTPMILVGSTFTAKFVVNVPAMQPPPGAGPPAPDPLSQYPGTGSFATNNSKFRGI